MKNLLITHLDLDGISPIILLNLINDNFDYKSIEISEIEDTFKELFSTDLSIYKNIYITDLTIPEEIYEELNKRKLNVKVFDHHATHLFAEKYKYATIKVELKGRKTCGTELFYNYLVKNNDILKNNDIFEYVNLVREIDTYNFTSDMPKDLELIENLYGREKFIKLITNRLKKNKEHFEFSSFEKRVLKIENDKLKKYLEKKNTEIIKAKIDGYECAIVFADRNRSELGDYIAKKNNDIDLVILINTAHSISYRTSKDNVDVATFASNYGGGGHKKASGSRFNEDSRKNIIKEYFKDVTFKEETIHED